MGPGLPIFYGVKKLIYTHICTPEASLSHCFREPMATMLPSIPQNLDQAVTVLMVMA